MSFEVRDQLARLGTACVERAIERSGRLPAVAHDPEWPSPCIVEDTADGHSLWRPVPMASAPDFSGLQRALECPLHVDVLTYYGSFWSGALPVTINDNDFELLQLWNDQDFDNLVSNLIGHALEKRRVRQPLSLFFASVDDGRFLSVDNASGEVFLETLGLWQPEKVADTLGSFLADLTASTCPLGRAPVGE